MEECCSGHSCDFAGASRREVLAALSAAAIALPALASTARAEATTAPAEATGKWTKTIKLADLPEHGSKNITEPLIVLTRNGSTVMAMSAKCTHKGCTVVTAPGQKSLSCPCHRAEFDYAGKNVQGPHKPGATAAASLPALALYALRLNAEGIIEVDTSKVLLATDKSTVLTIAG